MDDNKHNDQFNASLHLPDEPASSSKPPQDEDANPAADLIRKKIDAAYKHEPDAKVESEDIEEQGNNFKRSKHQEFIYNLTNSGRPMHEIQTAWHEYYAGLPDDEKHSVWQEFYAVHTEAAQHPVISHKIASAPAKRHKPTPKTIPKPAVRSTKPTNKPSTRKSAAQQSLHSLLFGLGIGSMVILIFMFTFFNDRIIAPFIQPSRNVANTPIINDTVVDSAPKVIIPKINSEVPVVYDVNTINDEAIQVGLQRGVVHYADTAMPGQNGNVVIVGHSSGNIFNAGNYKFAFSLLRALETGDTFFLQKDGKRYTYQVYEKKVVKPTDVSVLGPADKPATATLITCDPPGLNSNRLVIVAQQISPDPSANSNIANSTHVATATGLIPGNSPSLWSKLAKWFSG